MLLMGWMENCDLQVVIDEEQAIRYLVNYTSKIENHDTTLLIC